MAEVNGNTGQQPDHLAYLLHVATRRLRSEAEGAVTALPLQAAQARLLDLIPPDGGRVTDLAQRMQVSKQALGQLAAQLTASGYVGISPDPADKRAKLIRRTPAGDSTCQAMRNAIAAVEDRWRDDVGAERYATFRAVLQALVTQPASSRTYSSKETPRMNPRSC